MSEIDDTAAEDDRPWLFVDCTCEHPPEQHGWQHCDVAGCPCEGHWEE